MSDSSLVTLLLFLLGAGGNDLLDYLPTDAYWQAKQVQVSVESLAGDLKPAAAVDVSGLIADLGAADAAVRDDAAKQIRAAGSAAVPQLRERIESPDLEIARRAKGLIAQIVAEGKPAAVRRLMAVRTLGELKDQRAMDALRPLIESTEPFVADYARVAIGRIEGTEVERRRPAGNAPASDAPPSDAFFEDVWLLPADCAAVGQLSLRPGLAPSFEQAVATMPLTPQQRTDRSKYMTDAVLALAERVGNVRIDAMTFGVSGDVSDDTGYLVAIARGEFDRTALVAAARQDGVPVKGVAGFDVFQPDGETAFFFASDRHAVFMAAPAGGAMPAEAMAAAMKSGKGTLRESPDLPALIEAADRNHPIWAVAKVTPAYRKLPGLSAFDTISLVGDQELNAVRLKMKANGDDAEQVKAAAAPLEAQVQDLLAPLKKMAPFMPPLQPVLQFLESIRCVPAGKSATVSAEFKGSVTGLLIFLEMPFATAKPVDAEPAPAP